MTVNIKEVGKQENGSSSNAIYRMCLQAIEDDLINNAKLLDVGGGAGNFSVLVRHRVDSIDLIDNHPPTNLRKINGIHCDLNLDWPLGVKTYDLIVALEVIEHVENPRHFFREVTKLLKKGGRAFISTPNNESFFSKLNFLLKNQHRYFQESCYPAHITPLLLNDFKNFIRENGLKLINVFYSSEEIIPLLGVKLNGGGRLFSGNVGLLVEK